MINQYSNRPLMWKYVYINKYDRSLIIGNDKYIPLDYVFAGKIIEENNNDIKLNNGKTYSKLQILSINIPK